MSSLKGTSSVARSFESGFRWAFFGFFSAFIRGFLLFDDFTLLVFFRSLDGDRLVAKSGSIGGLWLPTTSHPIQRSDRAANEQLLAWSGRRRLQ